MSAKSPKACQIPVRPVFYRDFPISAVENAVDNVENFLKKLHGYGQLFIHLCQPLITPQSPFSETKTMTEKEKLKKGKTSGKKCAILYDARKEIYLSTGKVKPILHDVRR